MRLCALSLVSLGLVSSAHAQSFYCRYARTPDEAAICESARLGARCEAACDTPPAHSKQKGCQGKPKVHTENGHLPQWLSARLLDAGAVFDQPVDRDTKTVPCRPSGSTEFADHTVLIAS